MRPNISEFSYGYALTDELIHASDYGIVGVPIFPSLYQEGQAGGGYDAQLNRPGLPLFLQFKLSDCMMRGNCMEVRDGVLPTPCYRLHLRPKRFSEQHELLLDLEGRGHEVYYSAPAFHEPEELNDAYLTRSVKARSIWLRPSAIGPLPDDRDHHVSFRHPGDWYLYSEPLRLAGGKGFPDFAESLRSKLTERGAVATTVEELERLAEDIAITAERRRDIPIRDMGAARNLLEAAPAVRRIAYYAAVYLEAQFFVFRLAAASAL